MTAAQPGLMKWITNRARQLRRTQTPQEETLWNWLRDHRMCGQKFRRQHYAGWYYLDFACKALKLGIELDGAGHQEQRGYDADRDQKLRNLGWTILRFGNDEVDLRLESVLETIRLAIEKISPHPDPLPARGEGDMSFMLLRRRRGY